MGLFTDLFSTKPAEDAAAAKKAGLQQGYDALSGSYGAGQNALTTDLGFGRDALATNTAAGNNALESGYGAGAGAINSGADAARGAINSGYDAASGVYAPLVASTTAGANAYGDATGVNGADGIARGGSVFKSLPGYSGGLTTGIDAVNRGAAARGNLGGGQTSADEIKFASDYDANKYGNYVSSLAPYLGANASAVAGAAGLDTGRGAALGNIDTGQGSALNSDYAALGSGLNANYGALGAGTNANYGALGSSLNSSYQGLGNAANANYTGQGNAAADAALAPYSASSNFWSSLMGGANLLGKATGVGGFAAKPSTAASTGDGSLPSTAASTGDGSWYGQSSVGGAPLA